MKKTILLAIIALTFSGCSFVYQAQSYIEKHCPKFSSTNPLTGRLEIRYECDSLWPTAKIQQHCSDITLCVDAANGRISGWIDCDSISTEGAAALLKGAKPRK